MTKTEIQPPEHYPSREWITEELDPFYVEPALRDDYAQAFAPRDDYLNATRGVADAVPYSTWAHRTRISRALRAEAGRQRQAEFDRTHLFHCPSCGVKSDTTFWKMVQRPIVLAGHAWFKVCAPCHPVVEHALLTAQRLPDGRTRGEAAADLAARVVGELVNA